MDRYFFSPQKGVCWHIRDLIRAILPARNCKNHRKITMPTAGVLGSWTKWSSLEGAESSDAMRMQGVTADALLCNGPPWNCRRSFVQLSAMEGRVKRILRGRPLWGKVRLNEIPEPLVWCCLLRGFFDFHYQKSATEPSVWNLRRDERSYSKMLREFRAEGLLEESFTTRWVHVGKAPTSKWSTVRRITYKEVLDMRSNWETTDRQTLMMQTVKP